MHKTWAVIRREFLERVRTKWFLITTVLGPVFMVGLGVLPSLLIGRGGSSSVVMVDEGAGTLADRVEAQLSRSRQFRVTRLRSDPARHDQVQDSLTSAVRRGDTDGFLFLGASTIQSGLVQYQARNVSGLGDMAVLERAIRQALTVERLARHGIDAAVVQEAQTGIDFRTTRISKNGASSESGTATFFLGYAIALLLYTVTLAYGITVMRSVIQEKADRVIELLVSSLKPFQLMLGKVIGVGAVGLVQMTIWSLVGLFTVEYRLRILGAFGVPPADIAQVQMPRIGGDLVALVLAYFFLGYLFYSSLFAAVGAALNTEAEAGQAQQPVMMLLIISLFLSIAALASPGGPAGYWGSLVPFSSPIVMPVRVATSDVPPHLVAISLALLASGTLLVVWLAGRVYRIGILMYGKRPNIKELLRWARQS